MQHCRRCDDAARQHALLLWSQSGVWVRRTSCDALGSASDSARSAAAYLAVYSFTPLHWSASSALCCSTRSRGHCACGMAGHAAVLRSTASAPPPYHRRTANHLGIVHGDGGVIRRLTGQIRSLASREIVREIVREIRGGLRGTRGDRARSSPRLRILCELSRRSCELSRRLCELSRRSCEIVASREPRVARQRLHPGDAWTHHRVPET